MKYNSKIYSKLKAFTLIEILVTLTIVMVTFGATFLNYSYYQNKLNLKLSSKDISQALYNARNMAINGLDSSSGNVSVGVYFDNSNSSKNKISFYSYPFDLDINSAIDLLTTPEKKLLKEIIFYNGIQIDNVASNDKFLFVFQAITGSGSYFYWDSVPGKHFYNSPEIDVQISFMGSSSSPLIKKLRYITGTNIVDY